MTADINVVAGFYQAKWVRARGGVPDAIDATSDRLMRILFRHCLEIDLFVSDHISRNVERVLLGRGGWPPAEAAEAGHQIRDLSRALDTYIAQPSPSYLAAHLSLSEDDRMIVDLAVASHSTLLVTADGDFWRAAGAHPSSRDAVRLGDSLVTHPRNLLPSLAARYPLAPRGLLADEPAVGGAGVPSPSPIASLAAELRAERIALEGILNAPPGPGSLGPSPRQAPDQGRSRASVHDLERRREQERDRSGERGPDGPSM